MLYKNLINFFVAGAVALPTIIWEPGVANAQQFKSRQSIVNGLQNPRPRVQRRSVRRNSNSGGNVVIRRAPAKKRPALRAPSQNNNVVLRRAPSNGRKKFRAPPSNNSGNVILRRAPGPVAKRRAPPSSKRPVRAPTPQNAGSQQFRAPGPVAKRRAPGNSNQQFRAPSPQNNAGNVRLRAPGPVAKRRAPANNPQQFRAPSRSQNAGVQRRAPNRNPQQFNPQVATSNPVLNNRAIRVEEPTTAYNYNASVDLEILFEYNSAEISPQSVRQLIILGEALKDPALQNSRIMIAGHTDATGSNSYNNYLSRLRAQSVSDFLVKYAGVFANRLATEGYGEDFLKYPDAPESGQNRRVEIINLGS